MSTVIGGFCVKLNSFVRFYSTIKENIFTRVIFTSCHYIQWHTRIFSPLIDIFRKRLCERPRTLIRLLYSVFIVKMIWLSALIIFAILITSFHHVKANYVKPSPFLHKLDSHVCRNQSQKTDHCLSSNRSTLQEWYMKREVFQLMKSGRCGVKEGALFYSVLNRW